MRPLTLAAILFAALAAHAEVRLELVRESLTGKHCRYREYLDGIPNDNYTTMECPPSPLPAPRGEGQGEGHRLLHNRVARRTIIEDNDLPYAEDRDAATNALIRRTPLFFRAKSARIFDPNPVATLNEPSLQDTNDAAGAVPESAYKLVELDNLHAAGPLRGPHIALIDRQAPAIAPPDASASLLFNRNDDGFEDVNAYVHVDRTQRRLQALGYRGTRAIAPYAVETDAHAANGRDDSFFLPSPSTPGTGTLFFGVGGTDDAEDADLVVHEYGHALLEWITPGTFSGAFASQARAFSEGFGDYLAFSAHHAQRAASGRDPYCFADWDARCWNDAASEQCAYPPNSDCLRRLDSRRTMRDYETSESAGVEHRNGMIWSSAMRELFHELGRDVTDTILIESAFGAPPLPTFAIMAQRLIEADRLLYGGAHLGAICAAMTTRGITTPEACTFTPRGEWTHFVSSQGGIPIPEADPAGIVSRLTIHETRAIENVFVRVDIAHPSRGDLRIELVAPDGTRVVLLPVGFERARDVRVTFGIDAVPQQPLSVLRGRSANGAWELRVSDQRQRDVGTLVSWGLVFQFAGDAPASRRPERTPRQMIAVVAHRHGANGTFFASDLRIANVRTTRETATLVFTPSGANGLDTFSAVNVTLEAGQTVAYEDVLQSVFHTTGSGSLQILGNVIVMSRTYTRRDGGTVGQQVPPATASARRSLEGVTVGGFPEPGQRYNLGLTETDGHEVTVRIGQQTVALAPYSHVQFPVSADSHSIDGIEGLGAAAAYISQVDNATGDAMFIDAESTFRFRGPGLAPAVDTGSSGGWRSDLWTTTSQLPSFEHVEFRDAATGEVTAGSAEVPTAVIGILGTFVRRAPVAGVLTITRAGRTFHGTRIVSRNTSQYIPFRPPGAGGTQHLVFIENNAAFRTNIGIVSGYSADVIIYDSAGKELDRVELGVAHGLAQMSVHTPVSNGRVEVRFHGNAGYAYASLIDNATGDATYIESQ